MSDTYEALVQELRPIIDRLKAHTAEQSEQKRWNHADGWWEVGGYESILSDALKRIEKHRRRHDRILATAGVSREEAKP